MKSAIFVMGMLLMLTTGLCAQGDETAAQGIASAIEKINRAWTVDEGAALMGEVLSDRDVFCVFHNADDLSKATTMGRETFLRAFAGMLARNRPLKHVHTISKIAVYGAVAYEIGDLEDIAKDGRRSLQRTLNVFVKGNDGWKLSVMLPLEGLMAALPEKP